MKYQFILILTVASLLSFSIYQFGGHELKFDPPSEGFIQSDNGESYENASDNAILKGVLMTKPYKSMKEEIQRKLEEMEGVEILSEGDEQLQRNKGHLVKIRRVVDDGNDQQAILQYYFIFPLGHSFTGNMTATFPESLKDKYADAMLQSMGTARLLHNH